MAKQEAAAIRSDRKVGPPTLKGRELTAAAVEAAEGEGE